MEEVLQRLTEEIASSPDERIEQAAATARQERFALEDRLRALAKDRSPHLSAGQYKRLQGVLDTLDSRDRAGAQP